MLCMAGITERACLKETEGKSPLMAASTSSNLALMSSAVMGGGGAV